MKNTLSFIADGHTAADLAYLRDTAGQSGSSALASALKICRETMEADAKKTFVTVHVRYKPATQESVAERTTFSYHHAKEKQKFDKQAAPPAQRLDIPLTARMRQDLAAIGKTLGTDDKATASYALRFTADRVREMHTQYGKARICVMNDNYVEKKLFSTPYDKTLVNTFMKAARKAATALRRLDPKFSGPAPGR